MVFAEDLVFTILVGRIVLEAWNPALPAQCCAIVSCGLLVPPYFPYSHGLLLTRLPLSQAPAFSLSLLFEVRDTSLQNPCSTLWYPVKLFPP